MIQIIKLTATHKLIKMNINMKKIYNNMNQDHHMIVEIQIISCK
jgi:hypothetical protein